jgi:hypothetical protein
MNKQDNLNKQFIFPIVWTWQDNLNMALYKHSLNYQDNLDMALMKHNLSYQDNMDLF